MFTGLKPYPEHSSGGSDGSNAIPSHWSRRRLKSLARLNPSRSEIRHGNESGAATFLPMEAVSNSGQVDYSRRLEPSTSSVGLTYFRAGDILVAKITPCFENGKGAYLKELPTKFGFGSTEFHVLRAGAEIAPAFLEAVTCSHPFRQAGTDTMTGSAGQQRVPTEFLGRYRLPLPPLREQALIAMYLSHASARIYPAIRAKQKMIALLHERRQLKVNISISTRIGLNGVSWKNSRLKNVATVQTGLTLGKDYREAEIEEYFYLRVANVQSDVLSLTEVKAVRVPHAEAQRVLLRAGDVLMTEGGDIDKLGRAAIWNEEIENCLHQNHIFAVRCSDEIEPEYLVTLLGSTVGRDYFQATAKQTTNLASTNSATLLAFPFTLPPLGEQRRILADLRGTDVLWRQSTQRLCREVELLREFRTRLTTDVVTGQLDVRDAASKLPGVDLADLATTEIDDLDGIAEEYLDKDHS